MVGYMSLKMVRYSHSRWLAIVTQNGWFYLTKWLAVRVAIRNGWFHVAEDDCILVENGWCQSLKMVLVTQNC